jgi:hypothetical protein
MNATVPSPRVTHGSTTPVEDSVAVVVRRHLRWGWMVLLVFLSFGLVLEGLHGFKVQAYLNMMNETRRLMWTLAHAHGALLGLVNVGFAFTVANAPSWLARRRSAASYSLIAATLLMPAGFFVGGVWVYGGDPGLGILLVPVGGVLLFCAVLLTALSLKHFSTVNVAKENTRRQPAR